MVVLGSGRGGCGRNHLIIAEDVEPQGVRELFLFLVDKKVILLVEQQGYFKRRQTNCCTLLWRAVETEVISWYKCWFCAGRKSLRIFWGASCCACKPFLCCSTVCLAQVGLDCQQHVSVRIKEYSFYLSVRFLQLHSRADGTSRTKQSNRDYERDYLRWKGSLQRFKAAMWGSELFSLRHWCATLPFRCLRNKASLLTEAWHTLKSRFHLLILNLEGECCIVCTQNKCSFKVCEEVFYMCPIQTWSQDCFLTLSFTWAYVLITLHSLDS